MKSTYSNLAFEVLGLVLSRVTNMTYEEYIEDAIFKPLGMSKSTLSLPPDSAGVIPLNPHFWDVDEGIQNPTGGIYTSTNDMSKYLRYVLTHYNAIATGVNWVNPVSPSEGVHSFYGMPWEILHTDRVLKNSRRTVRFVTKGGGLPGYFSSIVTVPDYGLAYTILIAGEYEMLNSAQDVVGTTLVRAAEDIAIRQLKERYVGTYTSTNHTLNSTITLVADERGLVVERLISNGTDALASAFKSSSRQYVQLVPTLLYQDEKKQQGESWRIVHSYERIAKERSIWDDFCVANIDGNVYAGTNLNQLVFWDAEEGGKVAQVELSAFRVNLTRTEDHGEARWIDAQEILEL
jgi:CubicO group peptidase (beta-lactamase class C family)